MNDVLKNAHKHFAKNDKIMCRMLTASMQSDRPINLPKEKEIQEYFVTLVSSIVSQQISTKAAATIIAKLKNGTPVIPDEVAKLKLETLQSYGCSARKAQYIQSLAQNWNDLKTSRFNNLTNEEIIKRLTSCYGIGRWTAEMFLISAMSRQDVFAVADLGLRQQIANSYDVGRNDLTKINKLAVNWKPYRTVASLTLWHHLDNGAALL